MKVSSGRVQIKIQQLRGKPKYHEKAVNMHLFPRLLFNALKSQGLEL